MYSADHAHEMLARYPRQAKLARRLLRLRVIHHSWIDDMWQFDAKHSTDTIPCMWEIMVTMFQCLYVIGEAKVIPEIGWAKTEGEYV